MLATQGDVQVTTASDANCHLVSWSNQSGTAYVTVKCYSMATGLISDEWFDLLYTDSVGLAGVARPSVEYLFADKPSTNGYTPAAAYRFSTVAQTPSVKRSGVGSYVVTLTGMPKGGAVSVTSVGTGKSTLPGSSSIHARLRRWVSCASRPAELRLIRSSP